MIKDLLHTVFTKDHVESVIHKAFAGLGTWLISHGMLTAGGTDQFVTGGTAIALSLVLNFIASHEKKQQDAVTIAAVATTK